MGKKFILLVIICLLMGMGSGCSKKTATLSTTPPTGLQGQIALPGTTSANPTTVSPQLVATGQTTANPAPAPQSQVATPVQDAERQLNQVAGEMYSKVKMPLLMPSYWPPVPLNLTMNMSNYCGIQYSAGQDSYSVTITVVDKQLPVNSPELNMPPNDSEANQWGNFGGIRIGDPGVAAPNSGVVQKPEDGQPSAIGGYQGWQDRLSFYWESGAWQCEVQDSSASLMDDARSLTGSFKEAGELKGLQAKSGKILVSDANHRYVFISWVSADGWYEYTLQYDGEIADAIKIADSFSEVKKE